MIEIRPLKAITEKYLAILEKYKTENGIDVDSSKKLIYEIGIFWHKNQLLTDYFLNNISDEDEVFFLAGAVRLEIRNAGHYEYVIVGKYRLINDPFLKLSTFFQSKPSEINTDYFIGYLNDCLLDVIQMLSEYPEIFYVLPLESVNNKQLSEYNELIIKSAEGMILSMFTQKYVNFEQFYRDNISFEDIEEKILPHIRESLIYTKIEDIKYPLRERCKRYLIEYNSKIPFVNELTEVQLFKTMTQQFCMQALSIVFMASMYHMVPFIRNDVTFQYFTMIFHSNISSTLLTRETYLKSQIAYVAQREFDFSKEDFYVVKQKYGDGKLISFVFDQIPKDNLPDYQTIVSLINSYSKTI